MNDQSLLRPYTLSRLCLTLMHAVTYRFTPEKSKRVPFVYNEFTGRDEPSKPPGPPEIIPFVLCAYNDVTETYHVVAITPVNGRHFKNEFCARFDAIGQDPDRFGPMQYGQSSFLPYFVEVGKRTLSFFSLTFNNETFSNLTIFYNFVVQNCYAVHFKEWLENLKIVCQDNLQNMATGRY